MKSYSIVITDQKNEQLKGFFRVKTDGALRGAIQALFDKITEALLVAAYEIKGEKDERPKENDMLRNCSYLVRRDY